MYFLLSAYSGNSLRSSIVVLDSYAELARDDDGDDNDKDAITAKNSQLIQDLFHEILRYTEGTVKITYGCCLNGIYESYWRNLYTYIYTHILIV